MEKRVSAMLVELGVPANNKGYAYIRTGVLLMLEHKDICLSMTKNVYPTVAKKFDTNSTSVERAIRHAISIVRDRCDPAVMQAYFGSSYELTNGAFMARLADVILLEGGLCKIS